MRTSGLLKKVMLQFFPAQGLVQVCHKKHLFEGFFFICAYVVNFFSFLFQAVRSRRNSTSSAEEYEEPEGSARTVGTVRRHTPLDVRDPQGAILHFFVGGSYDPNRSA